MISRVWAQSNTFMPVEATHFAGQVDSLYSFLLISSMVACLLLIGGMIVLVIKYRRRSADDKTAYITHNTALEFLWSFVPFVIFMLVFVWGWWLYYEQRNFPKDAFEVLVTGQKWNWEFTYKSGKSSSELYVPIGESVKLLMTSRDVIHSFFIPSMRIKQDVIPNRYTSIWFKADKEGEFQVFCTEFCGTGHSQMLSKVIVLSRPEFDRWLEEDPFRGKTMAEVGQALLTTKGCTACHSIDGAKMVGPTFKSLFETPVPLADGSTATADENYLRESILNPGAKIVAGFPAGAMPTFQGQIKDKEILAIIEFIKTLK